MSLFGKIAATLILLSLFLSSLENASAAEPANTLISNSNTKITYDGSDDPSRLMRVFTGYFSDDWIFLKPRLEQLKLVSIGKRNLYLREVLTYCLQILKYADKYAECVAFPNQWMLCQPWRETARDSAMQILQELGTRAVPSIWGALQTDILHETSQRQKIYTEARKILEQRYNTYRQLYGYLMAEYGNVASERGWILALTDKEYTRIAWKLLLAANQLESDHLDADENSYSIGGSSTTLKQVNQIAKTENLSMKDALNKAKKLQPSSKIGRDGKLHRMVPFPMCARNNCGLFALGYGPYSNGPLGEIRGFKRAIGDEALQKLIRDFECCGKKNEGPSRLMLSEIPLGRSISIPNERGDGFVRADLFMDDFQGTGGSFLPPCEEFRTDLETVLERIGASAVPLLEKNINHSNNTVAQTAQWLIQRIRSQNKPMELRSLSSLENNFQRRARLALCVWDYCAPEPDTAIATAAKADLLKRGQSAIPEILEIMAIEDMGLGSECGRALELLTAQKWGDDYPSWRQWYDTQSK